MNKFELKFARVFLLLCAASAFIAWAGGFNFDHRSPEVACWVGLTMLCGVAYAFLTWLHMEDKDLR